MDSIQTWPKYYKLLINDHFGNDLFLLDQSEAERFSLKMWIFPLRDTLHNGWTEFYNIYLYLNPMNQLKIMCFSIIFIELCRICFMNKMNNIQDGLFSSWRQQFALIALLVIFHLVRNIINHDFLYFSLLFCLLQCH